MSEPLKKCREQLQYCQNRRMGGPERTELDVIPIYWSSGNRHKEGRSFVYGSITEQEKLMGSAKIPQPRRARKKVAILFISDGLARSSDEHPVMGWERRG